MIKRYQVFVSSTFDDLQEERQQVMQALLELDCIPAGMELFPAADEDQWSLIKEVINYCDYYIVLIGGRYGSLAQDGMGYTEMEYRYAVDIGKPVLAFLHRDPLTLPALRVESDPASAQKLKDFRALVQRKMCRFWSTAPELGGLVSRSVIRLIKHSPATGWIRADQLPSDPLLELVDLRRRLDQSEARLRDIVEGAHTVGLVQAFARQGDYGTESNWIDLLHTAIERVDLMGRTLYGWTQSVETADVIIRKIREEHVRFRMLIMADDNQYLPALEDDRVNIGSALPSKLVAVRHWADQIRETLSDSDRSLFELRCFAALPLYFSYIRIDDKFLITHYLCSANANSSPR